MKSSMAKLRRSPQHNKWGYADFFNERMKLKILQLANLKSSDVLYDLGCGDASFLIFAVKNFGTNAVGFENMPQRFSIANKKIQKAKLENKITLKKDMYEANLYDADVIFDMMPAGKDDFENLYSQKIRNGTRLIKHDLPLIGYVPDKIDYPFYRMTFPLKKSKTRSSWASSVLLQRNMKPENVWHELHYYQYEKAYSLSEIRAYKEMLSKRIPRP